jgi:hypothetical protein
LIDCGFYIQERIYEWQEANVRPSECNPDTPINRLIAEQEEIEEQILKLQVRRSACGCVLVVRTDCRGVAQ